MKRHHARHLLVTFFAIMTVIALLQSSWAIALLCLVMIFLITEGFPPDDEPPDRPTSHTDDLP